MHSTYCLPAFLKMYRMYVTSNRAGCLKPVFWIFMSFVFMFGQRLNNHPNIKNMSTLQWHTHKSGERVEWRFGINCTNTYMLNSYLLLSILTSSFMRGINLQQNLISIWIWDAAWLWNKKHVSKARWRDTTTSFPSSVLWQKDYNHFIPHQKWFLFY